MEVVDGRALLSSFASSSCDRRENEFECRKETRIMDGWTNLVQPRMAMPQVNLHEAKTHLSRLVEAGARGEEIVIAKAGKLMARLVPILENGR